MADSQVVKLPLTIGTNRTRSRSASVERVINMYPELIEVEPNNSPHKVTLQSTPGLNVWLDFDRGSSVLGMIQMGTNIFVVVGAEVFLVDIAQTITLLGILGSVPEHVTMTQNGVHVAILTSQGELYIATNSDLTRVADTDYQLASSMTFLDGYNIFSRAGTKEFFISGVNNASTFNALEFRSANTERGNLVAVASNSQELWTFGENAIEIYQNTGATDFPFERITGGFIERGCAASRSIATYNDAFYFLGDDRKIYGNTGSGYQLNVISTFGISREIETYERIDDAFGFIYTQEGHTFYVLSFPTANQTWVYDLAHGVWHNRQSGNGDRWRINSHTFFNNMNLVGDIESGIIYELDLDNPTENGTRIKRQIDTAAIFNQEVRFTLNRLYLDMDEGTGLLTGQGENPLMALQISVDGGNTFSEPLLEPIGQIGEYQSKVMWTRLGRGRQFNLRFSITDPVRISIVNLHALITVGRL